jgi:hypothetical protein
VPGSRAAQWLEDRQAELLDVPDLIATIAFQNQSVVYDILFRAARAVQRSRLRRHCAD